MFPQFRLTRQAAMLALVSTAFPCASFAAAAGHIDFALGNVNAVASDGRQRALTKGSEVVVGETINTNQGRAQIRFSDGAYVSLQPQTQFRVDDYKYDGKTDGSEKGFFSLLKGGLRSITGLVGRVNKQSYQVTTPTATIGIRGTEYLVKLDNGLRASVGAGSILLKNEGGSLILNAGQSGFAANKNTRPILTSEKPILPPETPRDVMAITEKRETYVAGDDLKFINTIKSKDLGADIIPAKNFLTGAANYNLAVSHDFAASHQGNHQYLNNFSSINSNGGLNSFDCCSTATTTNGSTSISADGNDGVIAWGRWSSGVLGGTGTDAGASFSGTNTFHYAIGVPTAVMPTTGSATYTVLGSTTPSTQTVNGSLTSATLNANFGTGTVTAAAFFKISGLSANFNGTLSISGSGFSGAPTASGAACTLGCSAAVSGFFAGAGASRAGLAYEISNLNGGLGSALHGTIAFTQ